MPGGRPKQFDREEVLARAMEMFWQQGYEASSLSDLLSAMGISRQSLYDTFGSKRGLYISAIEHYRGNYLSEALALLERDGPRIENVRALVGFFEELASDTRCRGCFIANAVVEIGSRDPEIGALLHQTLEVLRESVERTLRDGQQRGELPAEKSPERLSRALTNAMIGLAVTGRLENGRSYLHDIYAGTLHMLD